jgi:hypothetical protein
VGGIWLQASWSVLYQLGLSVEGSPASCAYAGVDRVRMQIGDVNSTHKVIGDFDCNALQGTAGPFASWEEILGSAPGILLLHALDSKGVPLNIQGGSAYFKFQATCGHPETWMGTSSGCPPGTMTAPGTFELPPVTFYITDEPIPEMRRIFEGAVAFFRSHGFPPPSASATPQEGFCCGHEWQGFSDICDPKLDHPGWNQPVWSSIGFQMTTPHFYSYEFDASGGMLSAFRVIATSDYDCNGVFATYEMAATLDPTTGQFTGEDQVQIKLPGD